MPPEESADLSSAPRASWTSREETLRGLAASNDCDDSERTVSPEPPLVTPPLASRSICCDISDMVDARDAASSSPEPLFTGPAGSEPLFTTGSADAVTSLSSSSPSPSSAVKREPVLSKCEAAGRAVVWPPHHSHSRFTSAVAARRMRRTLPSDATTRSVRPSASPRMDMESSGRIRSGFPSSRGPIFRTVKQGPPLIVSIAHHLAWYEDVRRPVFTSSGPDGRVATIRAGRRRRN
mmetsp:Transcript_2252/g.6790  ORF Transcript_2252/g.6790 Transcript_2252/m.6790 type:complete len:236 (-) Transcript_2252:26-733(-)